MADNKTHKIILKRRSIRFFKQKEVPLKIIKKALNCARLAPSAANLQFLEYLVVNGSTLKEKVFNCLRFAAYIAPKRNPPKKQAPYFYIILLVNKEKSAAPNLRDIGAAAENIMLSLLSFGIGSCWLQNINKDSLNKTFDLGSKYEIDSVIAAGFPDEAPKLETDSRNIKYWLDGKNRLHVPKRPLNDIWHYNKI
ncbi:MAG: nitroreductase family protein [Candidatus Omnitrophica bacterium]|nr:nitroreductase family protein [Candidatus Omnitrophota bacterium]